MISSVIPIQSAMSKNLNESLNATRSKTKGQKVEIKDANGFENKIPYLISGGLLSLMGILIYFVLPLAVISFNLGLLLEIFFLILIGMIFGLTLISFNLQRTVELCFVYIMLFFETKSMKLLIVKNLSAHRESNKLTSIIYSLTLGCIIFIIVAANLQL
jgi:FtsH-binding integral membrane protein